MTSTTDGLLPSTHEARGERVQLRTTEGAHIDAYQAAPTRGTGPGVVLVTSIFGVDDDTQRACDDLASRGCVALAPNFFWRDEDPGVLAEPDVQRAIARAMRIDFAKSMQDLQRSIEQVRQHPRCNGKVAVFGYCFGGPYAWRAACDGLGVDAAVSFHGTYVSKVLREGDRPACPVSFHYGEHDDFAPPAELEAVRRVAEATGSTFVVHPGAGHAYMMPSKSHYHAEAARRSWDAALAQLAQLAQPRA